MVAARVARKWSVSKPGNSSGMRTVSVRIPILIPGLGDDNLRVGRSATLPS